MSTEIQTIYSAWYDNRLSLVVQAVSENAKQKMQTMSRFSTHVRDRLYFIQHHPCY